MSGVNTRRNFISFLASSLGLCTFGGIVWSVSLNEAVSAPLILRPPAAKGEEEFLKACIKCGLCVEACPYDTLSLAKFGSKKPLGTPYFTPRDIPCYMCPDIPCVPACPTDALDKQNVMSIKDGKEVLDINKASMGVAVVDEVSCVAFWGIQCDACYRACPLLGKAIKLEFKRNERTGKHALLMPVVDTDVCTGCGLCEHACITKKAAIYVLPKEIALGDVGEHYIKGWDTKDESRLEKLKVQKQDGKKAVDYLNSEISYD
ncbi:MAG: ferredoxin-type protein NapG [Proteobacteria bacterium]|nr:MAG: ferredoxin-type protein NapG [Pseudomonadota bacterium]